MPFFTAVDSRAEVKGSRDPLGLVPVWSRFGRRCIGNLTTASGSARGFTTLLLGYYLAELVADEHDERQLDVFLRFEQVAAYTRLYLNKDADFRGERRARQQLGKTWSPPIGVASDTQILSDQKTYGLWGLYSTPARNSGLLRHGEPRLTEAGRDIVERFYLAPLRARGDRLERQLISLVRRDGSYGIKGTHAELSGVLKDILAPRFKKAEREEFDYHLVRCGPDDRTGGQQEKLAELLRRLPRNQPFGFGPLRQTIRASRKAGYELLASYLEDIMHLEHVIVPLQLAFLFALTRQGQSVPHVAGEIRAAWGPLAHVDPLAIERAKPLLHDAYGESTNNDSDAAQLVVTAAEALAAGDCEALLHSAMGINQFVMHARNGSEPWIRLDNGRLDVRYIDETDVLPDRKELPTMWRSTYFIDMLKSVIDQIDA